MPLRQLDKSRPYGEVYGMLGAAFEQDGVYFNAAGVECKTATAVVDEPPPVKDNSPWSSHYLEEVQSPSADDAHGVDVDTMSSKHLRVLVESYGGTWTNRKDAIGFLKKGK